jgi:hypothetical protein
MVHERVAQTIAGTAELARSVAARIRATPGFDQATTALSADDAAVDLEIQRASARAGRRRRRTCR